jgi:glycosyltransferase involved in cell wall biosynthesis
VTRRRAARLLLDEVTIGIATYNGARHVAEAVSSALNLGCRVTIFDDGSTDETVEVLQQFGDQAHVVPHSVNRGIECNYQGLLTACQTSHLLLLNQDDVIIPNQLMLTTPRRDEVTVFNGWVLDDRSTRRGLIYRRPPLRASALGVHRGLTAENFVRSPSQVIFPVMQCRDVGGFALPSDTSGGQGAEDWMCWLRLASAGVRFRLMLRPCVGYRVHAGNYSNNSGSLGASRSAVRQAPPRPPAKPARLLISW